VIKWLCETSRRGRHQKGADTYGRRRGGGVGIGDEFEYYGGAAGAFDEDEWYSKWQRTMWIGIRDGECWEE
jgi:hypothetical protein